MVMMKRIIISIPPHSSILTISIGTKVHMAVLLSTEKKKETEVTQSCPTLCDPMDCSLPGSSIHGIFQARILEWVAISFSRGSSWSRNWTHFSCISRIGKELFTTVPPEEAEAKRPLCSHTSFLSSGKMLFSEIFSLYFNGQQGVLGPPLHYLMKREIFMTCF